MDIGDPEEALASSDGGLALLDAAEYWTSLVCLLVLLGAFVGSGSPFFLLRAL